MKADNTPDQKAVGETLDAEQREDVAWLRQHTPQWAQEESGLDLWLAEEEARLQLPVRDATGNVRPREL